MGEKDINITSLSLVQFSEIFRSTYLFLNSNKEIQIYLKKKKAFCIKELNSDLKALLGLSFSWVLLSHLPSSFGSMAFVLGLGTVPGAEDMG